MNTIINNKILCWVISVMLITTVPIHKLSAMEAIVKPTPEKMMHVYSGKVKQIVHRHKARHLHNSYKNTHCQYPNDCQHHCEHQAVCKHCIHGCGPAIGIVDDVLLPFMVIFPELGQSEHVVRLSRILETHFRPPR